MAIFTESRANTFSRDLTRPSSRNKGNYEFETRELLLALFKLARDKKEKEKKEGEREKKKKENRENSATELEKLSLGLCCLRVIETSWGDFLIRIEGKFWHGQWRLFQEKRAKSGDDSKRDADLKIESEVQARCPRKWPRTRSQPSLPRRGTRSFN